MHIWNGHMTHLSNRCHVCKMKNKNCSNADISLNCIEKVKAIHKFTITEIPTNPFNTLKIHLLFSDFLAFVIQRC